ncbi:LamG domain-containing protein [Dactylosporangium maewongense]|uniref:LamG domain-containing protein n=1 Tax=Dactylosporangium maewongense TaxID=634393 RepID=A0ABP4KDE2_9ACTN
MTAKRALLRFLAVVLVGGAAPLAATAAAATAAPPKCGAAEQSMAAAAAAARACGRRVETTAARSATTQTFANADGSTTVERSAEPRFGRRADGAWVDLDLRLKPGSDGAVRPAASALPVTISGGGATPLAKVADGARELAVTWPGILPAPRLEGDTAVYPEVLPGVDLRVSAAALGFSEVLVIKDRVAAANPALRQIRFGLMAKGVTAKANGAGGIEARDPAGALVFSSPAPLMWDSTNSTTADRGSGTGGRRQAVMAVQVTGDQLTVVPDQKLLNDPAVTFPLFVDPSWTGHVAGSAWTSVWSRSDTAGSSFWQNGTALNDAAAKGGAGSGRTEDCSGCGQYVIRSIFRMEINGVAGKQIKAATFRVQQRWAWTCNPSSNARLWITDGISPSTTWNNQPTWHGDWTADATANHREGGGAGCNGTGDIEFDATAMVQHAVADGWPDLTLGLRAIDEGTTNHWKRFNAGSPVLAIDYNTPPNTPDVLTVDGKPCATGAGAPYVATATPTLRARATDVDNDDLKVSFSLARAQIRSGITFWTAITPGGENTVPNGGTAQFTTGTLGDGGRYRFSAQSDDQHGGVSPVTGTCEWLVDLVNPVAPSVTADIYPASSTGCPAQGCGSVGQTGTFTFASSPDVAFYRWGFADPPTTVATPAAVGGSVSVTWTPTSGGARTMYVTAVDRAGRTATTLHQFLVSGPSPAVARWDLEEAAGTTSLNDVTGHGHTATLGGGSLGAPGRIVGGPTALSLTGGSSEFATASVPELDSSKSFAVAAWVRPTLTTSTRAVISKDGVHTSAFRLSGSNSCGCWILSWNTVDAASTGDARVVGSPVVANVWVHLAGVYDAATGQATLYVDGKPVGTAAIPAPTWNATGPLAIGRARWADAVADQFAGNIAGVQVWNRSVTAAEVAELVDPLTAGVVGEWHMDEIGPGPAYDSSAMAHDLNFVNGAYVPESDAGQTGTGLRLNGVTAHARTEGQVLRTDQSFTVSSWVRMGDGDTSTPGPQFPIGNHNAVGQDGQNLSGFWLGLRNYDGVPRWRFSMTDTDTDSPTNPWTEAVSAPLATSSIGAWVHLVGVYDAQARMLKLYVNGSLAASVTRSTPNWDATGPLTIGAGKVVPAGGGAPVLTDGWSGDLDEIRVYAGAVADVTRIP